MPGKQRNRRLSKKTRELDRAPSSPFASSRDPESPKQQLPPISASLPPVKPPAKRLEPIKDKKPCAHGPCKDKSSVATPAINVAATNVAATNVAATNVAATNVAATNVAATNVAATNVAATTVAAAAPVVAGAAVPDDVKIQPSTIEATKVVKSEKLETLPKKKSSFLCFSCGTL